MSLVSTVLVVEDDQRLSALLVELLESEGYDVSAVARGDTAVQRILATDPAVVILDVNLPGMDGFQVCRAVRPAYRGWILTRIGSL